MIEVNRSEFSDNFGLLIDLNLGLAPRVFYWGDDSLFCSVGIADKPDELSENFSVVW